MKNIFNNPSYYINLIKTLYIPESKRKNFNSKSLLCLWPTKLCPAHCENCFFKSDMYHDEIPDEKYQFSQYGLERIISFANASNIAYLLIAGGGEPMMRKDIINELIRKVSFNQIVIVTNGIWAKSYESAKKIIDELYASHISKNDDSIFVLRLSVDFPHYQSIGNCEVTYSNIEAVSDNDKVIKIMPKQATLRFDDGYEIKVGIAKLFFSNLKVDLNVFNEDIQKAIDVFEKDMSESEYNNPSLVTNCDGSLGLDFWIDYNGNVTTWGNQQADNLFNVYVDSYQDFVKGTFNNIISYSFLDKGYYYREKIIKAVNPRAVLRSKAINLRDYASIILMEEDRTKLYYAVCVIKDYLEEGILTEDDISILPSNLLKVIHLDVNEIIKLYKASDYDIISQYFDKKSEFNHKTDWDILFTLIGLGHYEISENHLQDAINYYNETFYCNISSIDDILEISDSIPYEKFHERIAFMKKEAENFCLRLNC